MATGRVQERNTVSYQTEEQGCPSNWIASDDRGVTGSDRRSKQWNPDNEPNHKAVGVVKGPEVRRGHGVETRILVDLTDPSNGGQKDGGDDRNGDNGPEIHRLIFDVGPSDVPSFGTSEPLKSKFT